MRRSNAEIADDWRGAAWLPYTWRRASNQAGAIDRFVDGEGGGLKVHSDNLPGRVCYLKPRWKSGTVQRAAREKIASDLAYDLELSIPPVILADRGDAGAEERHVAVSLVMFPRQDSWEVVRRQIERGAESAPIYLRSLPEASARAWAFDTWLGQADHTDANPHNIIFGYDPEDLDGTGCFIFLDYAFSMGHLDSWKGERMDHCSPAPLPELMKQKVDKVALSEAIAGIEAFDELSIRAIVERIPVSHLGDEQKSLIVEGLRRRRRLVRQAFQKELPS